MPNDEQRAALLAHAAHWERLAEEQERTPPGDNRRKLYRDTGRAFRMEAEDGTARCSCCLKPYPNCEGRAK